MPDFKPFKPAPWLKNAHLQTLWPYLFRRRPKPAYQRQRIELPDGDFIDVDWLNPSASDSVNALTILVHGLQGSSDSHYMRGIGAALCDAGFTVAAMNFRGRSGEMNRTATFGHAGYTDDIEYVFRMLKREFKHTPISIMGVSLGASMVLNWLSKEKPVYGSVNSVAVISTPFLLHQSAQRMSVGFSKLYQHYLILSLKKTIRQKLHLMPLPGILNRWQKSKTFFEFDDAVTSRLHGFEDVDDYYYNASTKKHLTSIDIPLLIIHARDDPFMSCDVIPNQGELNPNTRLEVYNNGGHAGFVSAKFFKPVYWLDKRIVCYFLNALNNKF